MSLNCREQTAKHLTAVSRQHLLSVMSFVQEALFNIDCTLIVRLEGNMSLKLKCNLPHCMY